MLKAYNFFVPFTGNNLHDALFNLFKEQQISDYVISKDNRKRLVFYKKGGYIVVRSKHQPDPKIASILETVDVSAGDTINGVFDLPQWRNCGFNTSQIEAFKAIHGRLPSGKECKEFVKLEGERLDAVIMQALKLAGLVNIEFSAFETNRSCFVKPTQNSRPVLEVHFSATIENMEALEKSWLEGVGRDKTYGFGMLRVAKAQL